MRIALRSNSCQDWSQAVLMDGKRGTLEERSSTKFPGRKRRGTVFEATRHCMTTGKFPAEETEFFRGGPANPIRVGEGSL